MASLYRTVSRSVAPISRGAVTSARALSSFDRQARDESAVPPEIQQKATMDAERKLPKSLGDAQGDDTGRSHATDPDKSKVPEAIQEVVPESVERALPEAIHPTGDKVESTGGYA